MEGVVRHIGCRTTAKLLPDRSIKSTCSLVSYEILQQHFCCTVSWTWGGLEVYDTYLLQILVLEDHLDAFLLYTEGTVLYR